MNLGLQFGCFWLMLAAREGLGADFGALDDDAGEHIGVLQLKIGLDLQPRQGRQQTARHKPIDVSLLCDQAAQQRRGSDFDHGRQAEQLGHKRGKQRALEEFCGLRVQRDVGQQPQEVAECDDVLAANLGGGRGGGGRGTKRQQQRA